MAKEKSQVICLATNDGGSQCFVKQRGVKGYTI